VKTLQDRPSLLPRSDVTIALSGSNSASVNQMLQGKGDAAFVHADGSGPTTTHGQIHQFVGVATFLLIIAAMFTLVRPFRRDPVWRSIATPTLAWAIAAVACIFLVPISGAAYFGVAQRILLATLLSWLLTVSLHAHRTRHSRQTSPVLGMATQLAADEHRNLAPQHGISAN